MRTLLAALTLLPLPALAFELTEIPDLGLRIARGFEIVRYADHALAPDVYSMTLDPEGRVVVSARGYIKTLLDTDGDGRADDEALIAKSRAGAMGMLFLDPTTLLTTEGGAFNRYTDADDDGVIDPEPETIAKFGGGEHGAHAMHRGSDGSIYLIGGNDAKFRGHAKIRADQRDQIEGGALLRFDAKLREAQVVAHGFRNPYDFDFTTTGDLFCYDSDCEREFLLPWYSPTRLYRIEPFAHHGWRLEGWKRGLKRPDYYPDSVAPLVNVGRGSPTGVAAYRHGAFPPRFYDGVFYADWTFGKIYFTQPNDALLEFGKPEAEVFLESTGTNGFAPTDIAVAPDGSLFVSMGGRGTTGSVFHIRATKMREGAKAEPAGPIAGYHAGAVRGLEIAEAGSPDRATTIVSTLDKALTEESSAVRLPLIRQLMVALGDWKLHGPSKELFTAYELAEDWILEDAHHQLRVRCQLAVRPLLHSIDDDERREAARLLAMLRDSHPLTVNRLLDTITATSDPVEDFHYLTCLARSSGALDEAKTLRAATAIVALDAKHAGKNLRSKQTYSDRLNELVATLAERADIYPPLIQEALFSPGNISLLKSIPAEVRAQSKAIPQLAAAMKAKPDAGWSADAIGLLASGEHNNTPLLRKLSRDPKLAPACAKALAKKPSEEDRALFLRTGTLAGLAKLEAKSDAENLVPLFRSPDHERALKLISRAAGKTFADRDKAEAWLRAERPELVTVLGLGDGQRRDTDWAKRSAEIDWEGGDAENGAIVFAQRACATCHASDSTLGPALAGVAQRLSPSDLLKAIVQPNADVPEAYRATLFTLADGTTQIGRIAFSSADGVIVQTAAGTVRIDEGELVQQTEWTRSLMPEGLLDGLPSQSIADLRAYLATLR